MALEDMVTVSETCKAFCEKAGRLPYDADLEDIAQRQEQLWEGVKKILTQLSNLS